MKFGQNCDFWSKLQFLVKFVIVAENCNFWSKMCCLYSEKLSLGSGTLVGSGRLSVISWRLSVGPRRLSGWMDKSGRGVGQMGG